MDFEQEWRQKMVAWLSRGADQKVGKSYRPKFN